MGKEGDDRERNDGSFQKDNEQILQRKRNFAAHDNAADFGHIDQLRHTGGGNNKAGQFAFDGTCDHAGEEHICKSHYYGPTFYNFPYAFGGLFARGLYAQYQQEGPAFVPKYKKLLYTTPVATAEDAALTAGIDLTDRNFWRNALQIVADDIDRFCTLVQADPQ